MMQNHVQYSIYSVITALQLKKTPILNLIKQQKKVNLVSFEPTTICKPLSSSAIQELAQLKRKMFTLLQLFAQPCHQRGLAG